jgi:tetratricopeptide (TPR) repeat protein
MSSSRATLQELFDQAITLHQAGNLAGAERLYQQVLVMEPNSFGPRHMLGVIRFQQGRISDAIDLITGALELNPQIPAAWVNLGHAQAAAGQAEQAVASYRTALELAPGNIAVLNAMAAQLLHLGRQREVVGALDQLLSATPGDIEARNNRGNLLRELKRFDAALADYDAVLAARPDLAETWTNRGVVLSDMGRSKEALASLDRALALQPGLAAALSNRGFTLRGLERFDEALESLDRALALAPDFAAAHAHRGKVLSEMNRLDESFLSYLRAGELAYGARVPGPDAFAHEQRHELEQQDWLAASGETGQGPLRIVGGARLAARAVNAANSESADKAWRESNPNIVVIDNLLSEEAVAELHRYCLGSHIWHTPYAQGYLGAFPESGFAAPLLAQVAEELGATFRDIFAAHPLRYHWAFKYDSSLDGIGIHADEAAVNVNFWITPDSANRDPESGGLVVWDKAAPLDWDFAKFNGDEKAAYTFLEESGAKAIRIPYRANRAVIFDSSLFHKTDTIRFAQGYENRRINVTMLYGRRARG